MTQGESMIFRGRNGQRVEVFREASRKAWRFRFPPSQVVFERAERWSQPKRWSQPLHALIQAAWACGMSCQRIDWRPEEKGWLPKNADWKPGEKR